MIRMTFLAGFGLLAVPSSAKALADKKVVPTVKDIRAIDRSADKIGRSVSKCLIPLGY